MTEEAKAFFSYSRLDAEFALKLAKDLRNAGAAVWIDQLDISPGDHWDIAIQKAVGGSSSLLVVLSPHSVESENVMDEVSYALEEKKLVIPVLYRKCDIPLRLRRVQYIDVQADYDAGLQRILTQLQTHQKNIGSSPPQPPRATTAEWDMAQARAAAHAREREEAEKAAQERLAREAAERQAAAHEQRHVQEQRANQTHTPAPPRTVPASAQPAPSKKWLPWAIGGSVVLILLIALIATQSHKSSNTQQPDTSTTTTAPAPSPKAQPASTGSTATSDQQPPSTGTARPDLHQWLQDAMNASQGPSVEPLRDFFDDTVSPYYSFSSVGWNEIAADKRAYFTRFPEIHYQLLSWKHTPQSDGSEEIECDVQYYEIRKDGVAARGVTHSQMTVRLKDGHWKIAGIH